MASEVFNLDIQINSQPAEAALKRLQGQFDALKRNSGGVTTQTNAGLKTYTNNVRTASGATALFAKAIALVGFTGLATNIVSTIASIETLTESLKVVTGSAEGAAEALELINKIGLSSAFSVNEIGKAFINLSANGVAPTESLLRTFADTAAITTDRVGALNAISNLFARNVQGGLNLVDLNTLANQGIPVFKILADTLGVTRGAIADLGQTAEGAKLILDALKSGLDRQFAGASVRQAATLAGRFDILKENLQQLSLAAGGGGLETGLKSITSGLNDLVVALKPAAAAIAGPIGKAFEGLAAILKFVSENLILSSLAAAGVLTIFGRLPTVITAVSTAVLGIKSNALLLAASMKQLNEGVGRVRTAFPIFAADVGRLKASLLVASEAGQIFGSNLKTRLLGAMASVSTGVKILRVGFLAFLGPIGVLIAKITIVVTLFGYLKDLTISSGTATATLGELATYWFTQIGTSISGALDKFKDFASNLTSFVVPDWIKDIALGAKQLGKAFAEIVTPSSAIKSIQEQRDAAAQDARETAKFLRQAQQSGLDNAQNDAALKATQEAITNRTRTIRETVAALEAEASAIGQNTRQSKANAKILAIEIALREKLRTSLSRKVGETDTQFESRVNSIGTLNTAERQQILNGYTAVYRGLLGETLKDRQFELELVGKTAQEVELLTARREIDKLVGKDALGLEKERAAIIAKIAEIQAKTTLDRIKENVSGITKEIELLKLSNAEREKAVALDNASKASGFRDAADFQRSNPNEFAQVSRAIDTRAQETINSSGRESIANLKEQLELLTILDDKERQRVSTLKDIYKQIDPNGRGKNITDAQKKSIEDLQAQIEAQNALLEINKKIQESFSSLGDAVTKAFLNGGDAVKLLKLELIKLAALQIFRSVTNGQTTGAAGSFFTGLIGGLSGGRASGGPVQAGLPYRVGENGPETVVFPQSGRVIPNQDAQMRISSRSGSVTVQVNPTFQNHGNINSTEDLNGLMAQWGEGVARQTEKFVREQFAPSGLAYN